MAESGRISDGGRRLGAGNLNEADAGGGGGLFAACHSKGHIIFTVGGIIHFRSSLGGGRRHTAGETPHIAFDIGVGVGHEAHTLAGGELHRLHRAGAADTYIVDAVITAVTTGIEHIT